MYIHCKCFNVVSKYLIQSALNGKSFAIEARVTDAFIAQTNSCVTSVALGHM